MRSQDRFALGWRRAALGILAEVGAALGLICAAGLIAWGVGR